MSSLAIVWLRQDLRLEDQPAVMVAAREGPVVPVYILDDQSPGRWKIGGAQRWWLHHSLDNLRQSLERLGSRLILKRGVTATELRRMASDLGTSRVHAIRQYEPWWLNAEHEVAGELDLQIHGGDVLLPPEQVRTGGGMPYKIYTPYWRAMQEGLPPCMPQPAPEALGAPANWPQSDDLHSWALLPTNPNWASRFADEWNPGEAAAKQRLGEFAREAEQYAGRRDLPSHEGTSRLSPHLHLGEITPRQIWHALTDGVGEKFRKELAWRDFARNVMLTQPTIGDKAGRPEFEAFPWRTGRDADLDFRAWSQGRTGYPLVDAGMRQLWATGWMHNRVRRSPPRFS